MKITITKINRTIITSIFGKFLFGSVVFPSYIGKPLLIFGRKRIFLSKKVRILPNARIEVGKRGKLVIGENTSIGTCVHISCNQNVTIGASVVISSDVFISDTNHTFDVLDKSCLEQPIQTLPTTIGDYTFVGRFSSILPGSIIGKHCVVGCNSVVKGHIPDNTMVVGAPARVIKYFDFKTGSWVDCLSNSKKQSFE